VKLLDTWEPRTVCQHLGAYQTPENETPKNRGFGGHQDQDTTEATAFLPMARRGKSVARRGKSVARREETVARRGKGVARRGKSVARPRKSVARPGQGVARPGTVLATLCQGSGKRGKARGRQLHPGKCTDGWQTVRGSQNFGSFRARCEAGAEEGRRGGAEEGQSGVAEEGQSGGAEEARTYGRCGTPKSRRDCARSPRAAPLASRSAPPGCDCCAHVSSTCINMQGCASQAIVHIRPFSALSTRTPTQCILSVCPSTHKCGRARVCTSTRAPSARVGTGTQHIGKRNNALLLRRQMRQRCAMPRRRGAKDLKSCGLLRSMSASRTWSRSGGCSDKSRCPSMS